MPEDIPLPPDPAGSGPPVRLPPQDVDAERSVLGSMMLSKDAIADVVEVLKPGDFYRPAHETIYGAILDLYGSGEPADAVTVAAALTAAGQLARVGGTPYLHTLISGVPSAASGGYYAEIVAARAVKRRLVVAGDRIVQIGHDDEVDAEDAVDRAQAEVFDVGAGVRVQDYIHVQELVGPTLDELEAIGRRDGGLLGISTGFKDLDRYVHGWRGGQMIVVAARPGIGKSTLARSFVAAASIEQGLTSAIFSLEMSRSEITMALMAAQAKVALHRMQAGELTEDDWARLSLRIGQVSEAPIFIDDSPNLRMMEIRAKARRLHQLHGLRLIVIDYLQLMTGSKTKVESRQVEVSEISRQIKLLAKELDVPIIALSQLNRGPEQRADKKPLLSDLRESGSIEQDSDVVVLLHREDAYEEQSPRAGEADLILAKHRGGPTGTITVAFQGHYSRFVDMAAER